MNRLINTSCKLLICVLVTMCVGCRTKKSIAIESIKQTYNSEQVTTERNEKHISLIDTTNIDELTSVIREFVFEVPCLVDSFATDTNVGSNVPMAVYKADGSIIINRGLKSIKERIESRRNEKRGLSEKKDSTVNKQTNTKVNFTENKKHKDKHVEQVQIAEPFRWWQIIMGLLVLSIVVFGLKFKPSIKGFLLKIFNRRK
nr:MAG TPA: hypothetical protein [Bacteriophage sp.]DAR39917.1 MAG TPA: hypothetical protein [Caudoviricetes sp.]